ncbi:MAG: SRPBCC domain-containing protein [Bacteroidota bacterium]
MKNLLILAILFCSTAALFSQDATKIEPAILSRIDSTDSQNMVLIQTFEVHGTLDQVWEAYTTKVGWESWVAPLAEVDFKINGSIRTNYNKEGTIGDASTIVLHVVNFVPKKMITLQAELTQNFPEFMKEDAEDLFNVIYFEETSSGTTKVTSYGIGYKKTEKYRNLMKFFISGNEATYQKLISYIKTGTPTKF